MKRTPRGSRWGTTWSCWLACCLLAERVLAAPDFNRDVRPILSQYCFKCHGPDESKREAGVRLDLRETAVGPSDSGTPIIVPGHPEQSALMRRVESTDPDVRMPPPASHLQLTAAQKEILRAWIEAGAEYQPHWAFVPPQSAPRPHPQVATWSRNFIDDYILAALEQRGWQPSPEADRYTLIRRLSLDLIGIPPTWEEADTFAHDPDPLAYEKLVDRLLASPRYGERWARRWLDLARYADTNGYEKDRPRSMWPYRDWVIRALNADLPFDQFTIEQLAGDMLPQATLEQQIATGFHRNTMINEEGGIDPLEFRFYAMTDRVATTGTVWLGLTLGCAQCHTHKYDPIQLTEYYGLMAFLNNADELELEVPQPAIEQQRLALLTTLAQREATLPEQFPVADAWQWQPMTLTSARARGGSTLSILPMGVVMASGKNPAKDTYVVTATVPAGTYEALRVEALTDPNLGQRGPGRTPHGNFVLTEIKATWLTGETTQPLRFAQAQADYAQEGFPAEHVFDGNARTGWAIHGEGVWNVDRTLTLWFREPVVLTHDSTLEVELEQEYGSQHTLGKFRLSLGQSREDAGPVAWRRIQHYQEKYHRWLATQAAYAVEWIPLVPRRWHTNLPRLQLLPDGSLLASGDQTKRDVYELEFGPELSGATALRLEVLPDERLPKHGPGRVYYEGPLGDFFLSELQCTAGEALLPWRAAVHSFASGGNTAQAAIDGNPLTGWSINGGQGQPHVAVFQFASAVPAADAYTVRMIFERYYAAGLGRFRWSYTRSPRQPEAPALPPDVEQLLLVPAEHWSPEHQQLMHRTFCAQAPELAGARRELEQLRRQLPSHPTTLVFRERPRDYPRPTHWHRRGEFLQPQDPVSPHVPAILPPVQGNDRLAFARWLVNPQHPLTARVTVNRHWQAFFGTGIVKTLEDFGYQGELPTHPQLLDALALELIRQQWSLKALHRLIVTSATYRQASQVTPEALQRDPQNRWLARAPRLRLDAEQIRDSVLHVAGLLSDKMFGPSVFPPQPPNITTEGAYGQLAWNVSPGEDRYRRGLYTFSKRTAPYAMFQTFDAPSGEACIPRREVSNTPLQALTLLNDAVIVEAALALGRRWAQQTGDDAQRVTTLFQQCLQRPPHPAEHQRLLTYVHSLRARLAQGTLALADITADSDPAAQEVAVWMLAARVLFNLDEMITRE